MEPVLTENSAIVDDGERFDLDFIELRPVHDAFREKYPNADLTLLPILKDLLVIAKKYHTATKSHLQVYGDIGELFGAVTFGIDLHSNYAQGSDGRLGNDFVEIKTITPFKGKPAVSIDLKGNFSKLLVVKIDEELRIEGRLVARASLPKSRTGKLMITWDSLENMF
jgi:hypothetical protein